jgi:hypothetical protein
MTDAIFEVYTAQRQSFAVAHPIPARIVQHRVRQLSYHSRYLPLR